MIETHKTVVCKAVFMFYGLVNMMLKVITAFTYFQWMLLDDLFEQERNIRMAMANRAGVLGLLLHQTVDYDPLKPMLNRGKVST